MQIKHTNKDPNVIISDTDYTMVEHRNQYLVLNSSGFTWTAGTQAHCLITANKQGIRLLNVTTPRAKEIIRLAKLRNSHFLSQ